jgi:hypothetical protein
MPMNPRLLRPRALQGVPIYLARLGMKFLAYNNAGALITSGASANTAGAWVQILANNAVSAAETIVCLNIRCIGNNQVNGNDNSVLMDVGIGAAGSETVVASGIAVGGGVNSGGTGCNFALPVKIPGATRVALRIQCAQTSRIYFIQQVVFSGQIADSKFADQLPTSVDVLGTDAATSAGTAMSGASGTWVEITPSTTKEYQALALIPSGPQDTTGGTQVLVHLDLGIGAAGSEEVIAHVGCLVNLNGVIFPFDSNDTHGLFGGLIPAGTRIAVRHDQAASPGRVAACVIGVPFP